MSKQVDSNHVEMVHCFVTLLDRVTDIMLKKQG
jgi:hypothetical protein